VTKKPRGRPRVERRGFELEDLSSLELHGTRRAQAVLRDRPFTPAQAKAAVEGAERARITNALERLERISRGEKVYGLRLTLPGAPNTPHGCAALPGAYFRPDRATPVGGRHPLRIRNEPTLEEARRVNADPGCDLELVELTEAEVRRDTINPTPPVPHDTDYGPAADPLVAEILAVTLGSKLDSHVRNLQHHARRERELTEARLERLSTMLD
jgi:hypothetical protein